MDLEVEAVRVGIGGEAEEVKALCPAEIFRGVDSDSLARLLRQSERESYRRGQSILGPDRDRGGTYVVLRGSTRMVRLSDTGEETTLRTFAGGEVFGLPVLCRDGLPRSAVVAAADGTEVFRFDRRAFREFMTSHPEVAMQALDLVSRQLRDTYDRMVELARCTVAVRLARTLAREAAADRRHLVRATHEELASWVGTRREEVSRAMGSLRHRGLIICPGRGLIVVPDPERLLADAEELC